MEELAGNVAVVTGAGSGIGRGIALALAADRMLLLADIDANGLAAIGAQLRADGAEAIEVLTDVREARAVGRLAAVTLDTYGAVHPDGGHVVNVSSMGGLLSGPMTGPYSASKHAIVDCPRDCAQNCSTWAPV